MKLIDLIQLLNDCENLDINALDFEEPLYFTSYKDLPYHLLERKVSYLGAKCEDCLAIFLEQKTPIKDLTKVWC